MSINIMCKHFQLQDIKESDTQVHMDADEYWPPCVQLWSYIIRNMYFNFRWSLISGAIQETGAIHIT